MARYCPAYIFPIAVALLLAGCLMTAQETVKKTVQSQPDRKQITAKSESEKSRGEDKGLESAEEKIALPKKRRKSGKADSKSEEQEVRLMAKDLAKTYPNVRKAKICYDLREDEWWITLYEDEGYYCELRQYVWSFTRNALNKFLRQERVSKKKLEQHLTKKEPSKSCQILEIETGSSEEASAKDAGKTAGRTGAKKAERTLKRPLPPKQKPRQSKIVSGTRKPEPRTESSNKAEPAPKPRKLSRPTPSPKKTVEATKKPRTGAHKSERQTRRADSLAAKAPVDEKKPRATSRRSSDATPSRSELSRMPAKKPTERRETRRSVASQQTSRGLVIDSDGGTNARTDKRTSVKRGRAGIPTFHVFVYGSEMKHPDLLAWLEANGYDSSLIVDAKPAKLRGYDYVWNFYAPSRKGGAVNLEPKRGSTVWGLLIECEDSLLKAFDDKEGHPNFYERSDKRVRVERVKDGATAFAWLYLAKPNKGKRRDVWPTETYKEVIIEGARFWRFPEQYIERLKKWPTR